MTEKFGGDVLRKYAGINQSGRKALEQGAIAEQKEFSPLLKNRFNASMRFNAESIGRLDEALLDELRELEKKSDIRLLLANRDFPVHSTLQEAAFEKSSDETDDQADQRRDEIFSGLRDNPDETLKKKLAGQQIDFKYLLIDKGNLILTADRIPAEILDARAELAKQYEAVGLKPSPIKNILHLTVSRIAELPTAETDRKNLFTEYEKKCRELRRNISRDPIALKVEDIYRGNVYDLLAQKKIIIKLVFCEKLSEEKRKTEYRTPDYNTPRT